MSIDGYGDALDRILGGTAMKLSENQQASVDALKACLAATGAVAASKAVWRKACPDGVSVYTAAMVKTGAVVAVPAAVSTNGKLTELYKLAD